MNALGALLAQHDPGYRSGQMWVNAGSIMVLVGLAGVGMALLLSKAKPGTANSNLMATRLTGVIVIIVGVALAWYMWK